MTRFVLRMLVTLSLACALCAMVAPCVYADANEDQARLLFEAGIAASRQARWVDAQELFARSGHLVEKPSTLLNLAIAQVNLGRNREALTSLARLQAIADPQAHAAVLERARALKVEASTAALAAARTELATPTLEDGEASKVFEEATIAYAEGRYAEALADFERAQALSPRPELHYNIGLFAEHTRAEGRALLAFEAFVAALPDDPRARPLMPRIAQLKLAVRGQAASAPAQPMSAEVRQATHEKPPTQPPPQTHPSSLRLPRILLGTGGATAATAIVATVWWTARRDTLQGCRDSAAPCLNESRLTRHRNTAFALSLIMDAATVGLMIGGGVLLHNRKAKTGGMHTWLRLTPLGIAAGFDHL